jgi:hypothetical protein
MISKRLINLLANILAIEIVGGIVAIVILIVWKIWSFIL